MRCFAHKVHFFGVTKTGHYRVKVHTLASCWCLDRGPPRWQSSHQCQPLGRLLCCGRSPCKLDRIHEASLAQHRFQQTPATPPAHSLPPAEPVTKKEQLEFFLKNYENMEVKAGMVTAPHKDANKVKYVVQVNTAFFLSSLFLVCQIFF